MRKLSFVFFLALLLCLTLVFTACEEPVAGPDTGDNGGTNNGDTDNGGNTAGTTDPKKDVVVDFFTPAQGSGEAPVLPEMPSMDSVMAGVTTSIKGIAFAADADIKAPMLGFDGFAGDVMIKDGTICMVKEDGSKMYFEFDENLNLYMMMEAGEEMVAVDAYIIGSQISGALKELETMLGSMTGNVLDKPAIPEIPALTADDLTVEGNRVTIKKDYYKKIASAVIASMAGDTAEEQQAAAEQLAAINMILNSVKLDVYFLVNDANKMTGFGVDIDVAEAGALFGMDELAVKAEVTLDPATSMLTKVILDAAIQGAKFDFTADATYAAGALIGANMKFDATLPVVYADATGETPSRVVGEQTITSELKLDLVSFAAADADILTFALHMTEKSEATENVLVDKLNATFKVDKTGTVIGLDLDVTTGSGEEAAVLIDAAVGFDTAAVPAIPEISAALATEKQKADVFLKNAGKIMETMEKLGQLVPPAAEEMRSQYYYFDATCNAAFYITPQYTEDEFSGWGVTVEFTVKALNDVTITVNPDGSFSTVAPTV